MKRTLFLVLFICTLSSSGFGQVSFGIKAGANFSQFHVNTEGIDYTLSPGFDAGLFTRVGGILYFQPEVLYSLRSTTPKLSDELVDMIGSEAQNQSKEKVQNIDFPLLLGCRFGTNYANFRIFAGPRLGFVLSTDLSDYWSDIKSSNFDVAGQVGIGIDLWMVTLDLLYDYTFTEECSYSVKNVNSSKETSASAHMSCLKFMVGIKLF